MNFRQHLSRVPAKYKTRPYLFGAAAVFFAGFAALWLGAMSGATENLGVYSEALSFVDTKVAEKNLFPENGEAVAAKFEEALARGTKALDLASSAEMAEAPLYKIDELRSALVTADQILQEKKKLGLTADLGLVGSMRGNAMQAEIALLERQQWKPVAELLYMRKYERDVMDRLGDASVKEYNKYGANLEQDIAQAYLKRGDKEFLTEKVRAYRQDFTAVVETLQNMNALSASYINKSAAAKKVLSEFENAAPKVDSEGKTDILIGILGILAVLALAGAATGGAYFMRVRYGKFEKLMQYMDSLLAGNTQDDVPFTDHAGELGKMAAVIAELKDALLKQEAFIKKQEAINQNQADYEEEASACIDRVVAEAEELTSRGQEILRKASEVMKGSLSVSEEIADTNSLVLRLAERVDAVDGSLRYLNDGQTKEAAEGIKYQIAEIRGELSKAISKILNINAAILEVKGMSKEMAISAEGQGPATRGVVRGVRYVSSITQERMAKARRA